MAKGASGWEADFPEKTAEPDQSGSGRAADQAGVPAKVYSTETLFGPEHEIAIRHAGTFYRLRITRQGKLILNK